MNISGFLFALTTADALDNWNMTTQNWLKYYIYMRVLDRSKPRHVVQIAPIFFTMFFSAFWHGCHLKWYLGFGSLALAVSATKLFSKTKLCQDIYGFIPYPKITKVIQ